MGRRGLRGRHFHGRVHHLRRLPVRAHSHDATASLVEELQTTPRASRLRATPARSKSTASGYDLMASYTGIRALSSTSRTRRMSLRALATNPRSRTAKSVARRAITPSSCTTLTTCVVPIRYSTTAPWLRGDVGEPRVRQPRRCEGQGHSDGDTVLISTPAGKGLGAALRFSTFCCLVLWAPHGAWVDVDEKTGIDRAGSDNYPDWCGVMAVSAFLATTTRFATLRSTPVTRLSPDCEYRSASNA